MSTLYKTLCCGHEYFGINHSPVLETGYCLHCGHHPEIEKLKKALEIAKKALEDFELKNTHIDSCGIRYQGGKGCTCMDLKYYGSYECEQRARQALKEIEEVLKN